MNRLEKMEFAKRFGDYVHDFDCMILVRHTNLKAGDVARFRSSVRRAGGVFKVVKNSLAVRGLGDLGEGLSQYFKHPIGVLFSGDPVSLSKIAVDFAKKQEKNFQVVAGCLNGTVVREKDVVMLSQLPSLNELRAEFLRALLDSATSFVRALQDPAVDLVRVVQEPAVDFVKVLGAQA